MAAAALSAQLNAHIAAMYAEGVVDEDTFQELRENGTAAEVARLIINDTYPILDDIRDLMSVPPHALPLLSQPAVHFNEVEALLEQLIECTTSVGAKQVNLACRHFRHFNAIKYEQKCLLSLTVVRTELSIVRNEL
ncbi:histidine-containing phosphotransfer protein 2-like [Triticum aestivum]|uniref:histidine-containing phosphotransfer protein 2-like n=1 Tax=Triticum aestivum TaxID=4565 RepID=UPI001D00C560|nr:histidine-containing phosphotransfer protein 2-like [Triticum aestivum]